MGGHDINSYGIGWVLPGTSTRKVSIRVLSSGLQIKSKAKQGSSCNICQKHLRSGPAGLSWEWALEARWKQLRRRPSLPQLPVIFEWLIANIEVPSLKDLNS